MHRTVPEFWAFYRELPDEIKEAADSAFALLEMNPRSPSLRLKKVGTVWSARVTRGYRALARESEDGLLWYWIGPHVEYERKIRE